MNKNEILHFISIQKLNRTEKKERRITNVTNKKEKKD
jgi:hypothetical protein